MRIARWLIVPLGLIAGSTGDARSQDTTSTRPVSGPKSTDGVFLVKPYLQWGDATSRGASGLLVLWQTGDEAVDWSVEYRPGVDRPWGKADAPTMHRIAVPSIPTHRLYRGALKDLVPGDRFSYRLTRGGQQVFEAEGAAPKASDQAYRFVAFGDCAAGTPEQKAIAHRTYQERPDFVFITGDIVYARGRISEYREKFWPVYNADEASPSQGAPLLRSTVFLAAPGNHDIATRDLEKYPDGLAYFLYWDQPLNGPSGGQGSSLVPPLKGPDSHQKAFLDAAGPAYPRMANFSFDYGNAHWTVLDSNPYVELARTESPGLGRTRPGCRPKRHLAICRLSPSRPPLLQRACRRSTDASIGRGLREQPRRSCLQRPRSQLPAHDPHALHTEQGS